ncbi:MAG: hypothetical protein ACREO6_05775, partial [Rudaea sp.]
MAVVVVLVIFVVVARVTVRRLLLRRGMRDRMRCRMSNGIVLRRVHRSGLMIHWRRMFGILRSVIRRMNGCMRRMRVVMRIVVRS